MNRHLYKYTHEWTTHAIKAVRLVLYFEKIVTADEDGLMVKNVLSHLALSKRLRRDLLNAGHIQLNGKPIFLTSRIHTHDKITVLQVDEIEVHFPPEPIALDIAYEDEHLLVVNKQAGLLVHPTSRERTGTLASAVAFHMCSRGESYRFRPVHRLDRNTSGLLLIAKHKLAHERLSRALRKRDIHREYLSFVYGLMENDDLTIDTPIGLAQDQTVKRIVDVTGDLPSAKPAVTHVKVLCRYEQGYATKVRVILETGRTHQIRVHLSSVGHSVLGDTLYGEEISSIPFISRQALHAYQLTFVHPVTKEYIVCVSELPDDLQQLEKKLAHQVHES